MPESLSSFLVSVSIIIALALFIPCIESIAKLVRRNSQREDKATLAQREPVKAYSREVA